MNLGVGLLLLLISACSDDDSLTQGTSALTTVDDLLARVCELGGDRGGSTQADIDQCPAELLTELDADKIAGLAELLALDKGEQDRILECFAGAVCDRFGSSVLA